jgi:hypothetical protein
MWESCEVKARAKAQGLTASNWYNMRGGRLRVSSVINVGIEWVEWKVTCELEEPGDVKSPQVNREWDRS